MSTRKSDRMAVASPMSYRGSTQRITNIVRAAARVENPALRWGLAIPAAVMLAAVLYLAAWGGVTLWYLLFGVFAWPFRLFRRGSRKRKIEEQRHRELVEAAREDG